VPSTPTANTSTSTSSPLGFGSGTSAKRSELAWPGVTTTACKVAPPGWRRLALASGTQPDHDAVAKQLWEEDTHPPVDRLWDGNIGQVQIPDRRRLQQADLG